MAHHRGPLESLLAEVRLLTASPAGRATFTTWTEQEPVLARFPDFAELPLAVAGAAPAEQDLLITAILRIGDPAACLVTVAVLAQRLRRVIRRWSAAGVGRAELVELEQDLVAECWVAAAAAATSIAAGGEPPTRPGLTLVDAAWAAVRTPRLRRLRCPFSQVPLDRASHQEASRLPHPDEELFDQLTNAVRRGAVSRRDASLIYSTRLAGLSVERAAHLTKTSPEVFRQIRCRAERRFARTAAAAAVAA